MKIGIQDNVYYRVYGFEGGLKRMRQHGYECIDYQGFINTDAAIFAADDKTFDKMILGQASIIRDNGIEISQAHGPWRSPQDATEADRAERFEKMSRSIRGTALLGCHNYVIHPIMPFGVDDRNELQKSWDMNLEFMGRLAEVGRANDVVVCFENMPFANLSFALPEPTVRFVRELASPYFKVCLDTGHSICLGMQPGDAVRLIGKEYLQTMHVHDNNGRSDMHWLPYTGVIDWEDFSNALAEIQFEGTLSLETGIPPQIPLDIRELQEISLFQMAARLAKR